MKKAIAKETEKNELKAFEEVENKEFFAEMEKLIHKYYTDLNSSTFVIKLEKVSLCEQPYIIEITHYKNN